MSGYRRPAGGSYLGATPSVPSGGYSSGRYSASTQPLLLGGYSSAGGYSAGATRLVSSTGVPRRYQVYSRNDTPLGLTNYDVVRRAVDPLAARYRQNRHSWAAGGGGGLSRSCTVASVDGLQWRRGRRESDERVGDRLALPSSERQTVPPSPLAAEQNTEPSPERHKVPPSPLAAERHTDSPASPPAAGETRVGSYRTEAPTEVNRSVSDRTEPAQKVDSTHQSETEPPAVPPRRNATGARSKQEKIASAQESEHRSSLHTKVTDEIDQRNSVENMHESGVKLPGDGVPAKQNSSTDPRVQKSQELTNSEVPVKVNKCKHEESRDSDASSSIQPSVVSSDIQTTSHDSCLEASHASVAQGIHLVKETEVRPNTKAINLESTTSAEPKRIASITQSEADTTESQPVGRVSPPPDLVRSTGDDAHQETVENAVGPVPPPRHKTATGKILASAVASTSCSTAGSQNDANSPVAAAPELAQLDAKTTCNPVKAPEQVIAGPKSGVRQPDRLELAASSVLETSSSEEDSSDDDSSYTDSSTDSETSTTSDMSEQHWTRTTHIPSKPQQTELVKDQQQVKKTPVLNVVVAETSEKAKIDHAAPQHVANAAQDGGESIDVCLDEKDADLLTGAETKDAEMHSTPVSNATTDLLFSTDSTSCSAQNDELSFSESISHESYETSFADQEESKPLKQLSGSEHACPTEPNSESLRQSQQEKEPHEIISDQNKVLQTESTDSEDHVISESFGATDESSAPEESHVSQSADTLSHSVPFSSSVSRSSESSSATDSSSPSRSCGPGSTVDTTRTESRTSDGTSSSGDSSSGSSSEQCSSEPELAPKDRATIPPTVATSRFPPRPSSEAETLAPVSTTDFHKDDEPIPEPLKCSALITSAPSQSCRSPSAPTAPVAELVTPAKAAATLLIVDSDLAAPDVGAKIESHHQLSGPSDSNLAAPSVDVKIESQQHQPMSSDSELAARASVGAKIESQHQQSRPSDHLHLSPIHDEVCTSLSDSDSSSVCSEGSSTDSETSSYESDQTDSSDSKPTPGSDPEPKQSQDRVDSGQSDAADPHPPQLGGKIELKPDTATNILSSKPPVDVLVEPKTVSTATTCVSDEPMMVSRTTMDASTEPRTISATTAEASAEPTLDMPAAPATVSVAPTDAPAEPRMASEAPTCTSSSNNSTCDLQSVADGMEEIIPRSTAVMCEASPRPRIEPVIRRRSRALQPAVDVQESSQMTRSSGHVASVVELARPARAQVTVPEAARADGDVETAAVETPAAVEVRLRHRPQPTDGADAETPAMVARRQRRIRRTASSPEVGDLLVRLDSGGERQSGLAPLRRRVVVPQQKPKPRETMTPSSLHDEFMRVCIRLNEPRFREVMLVAARIATAATVNQTDPSGRTALSHLCVHGNGRCVEEFSRLPFVDANLADKDGNTPLHHAAQAGHAAVVSALLENYTEIEVDARNAKGITPLIKACVQGKSKCAKLLLAHGADALIRDPTLGLSCIEWSYYCGRHACARLVQAYLLERSDSSPGAGTSGGGGGGLKRVSSEPELVAGGARPPGSFGAKCRRLLGGRSPPPPPPPPPRLRRPSLPAAGEALRARQAPPRPPGCLPQILVEEVEVPVDPVIVRYGDWVAPSQRPRQHNQVANLCLPGTAEEFVYE